MKDCYNCEENGCVFQGQDSVSRYADTRVNVVYSSSRDRARKQMEHLKNDAEHNNIQCSVQYDSLYHLSYAIGEEVWIWINPENEANCQALMPAKALIDVELSPDIVKNYIKPYLKNTAKCQVKRFGFYDCDSDDN